MIGSRRSGSPQREALIDTCAGRCVAEWLRSEGHDVERVTDAGPDPGDAAILSRAAKDGRILITLDKDFGALVHQAGLRHAGLIRLPHCPASERTSILEALLARHAPAELEGALVTVRGTRIRIPR